MVERVRNIPAFQVFYVFNFLSSRANVPHHAGQEANIERRRWFRLFRPILSQLLDI
jgi:hypothetical protein